MREEIKINRMKKRTSAFVPAEIIEKKIYLIRGHKVMIDRDLAEFYKVTTGNLNKAVSRGKIGTSYIL